MGHCEWKNAVIRMKRQIHTNLVGRLVCLTEEAKMYPRWHSRGYSGSTAAPTKGDFANLPGGEYAIGEIVAAYLEEGRLVVTVCWKADGSILDGLLISNFRILFSEDPYRADLGQRLREK
jgi:hypothetical protein